MRFLLFFFILGSILVWQGCKTQKVSFNDFEGPRLTFGQGGGFTGAVTEYTIFPNGQIFIKKNTGSVKVFAKIKKRTAKKLFKKADELDLLNKKYKKPGNMYYYIGYKKDKQYAKSVWGREKHLINPALDSFLKEFYLLIPDKKSTGSSSAK